MAEERVQRRLAAILAADVVGYSRLMEQDEAGTLAALKARREACLSRWSPRIAAASSSSMGDGVLVEFGSAVNAVQCAVDTAEAMAAANAGLPEASRIVLRIGINLGDVIVEGGDIYGDGVNIAARLRRMAEPGGICVSGKRPRPGRATSSTSRSRTWASRRSRTSRSRCGSIASHRHRPIATSATGEPPAPDKPSIAVLPFENMSGDPEQEYFADGMVEDIITALSRLRWLFVIARNSSFTYKGRAVDVKQVGRELGVRYVLEGSVRKAANRVRITGQLIDASTGAHLWADRFDGGLEDIFDLQDQVTASVVGAIAPKLEQAEIERAKRKPTENLDAYDYYLRGMAASIDGPERATTRRCDCSTGPSNSTPISLRPMAWQRGAMSGARRMAGWRSALKRSPRPSGWPGGQWSWARMTRSRSAGRDCACLRWWRPGRRRRIDRTVARARPEFGDGVEF